MRLKINITGCIEYSLKNYMKQTIKKKEKHIATSIDI